MIEPVPISITCATNKELECIIGDFNKTDYYRSMANEEYQKRNVKTMKKLYYRYITPKDCDGTFDIVKEEVDDTGICQPFPTYVTSVDDKRSAELIVSELNTIYRSVQKMTSEAKQT